MEGGAVCPALAAMVLASMIQVQFFKIKQGFDL
jgi:hypothetical protein